jgi:hypothetical protein
MFESTAECCEAMDISDRRLRELAAGETLLDGRWYVYLLPVKGDDQAIASDKPWRHCTELGAGIAWARARGFKTRLDYAK